MLKEEKENISFIPNEITVPEDSTVVWFNNDNAVHTVTSGRRTDPTGLFDATVEVGGTFSFFFEEPGTYASSSSEEAIDMQIGILGLGKMGKNMARRLARAGHRVVVYNRTTEKALALADEEENVVAARTFEALAEALNPPRAGWAMVPAGAPTDKMVDAMLEVFDPGDVVIDGANSNYEDSLRHAEKVSEQKMHFLDVGVSGGVWGLEEGYSLMVGGEEAIVERLRPIFEDLAPGPDRGWGRVGPNGAGHFVKMVHNGIEYGMMEAYAEGFEILKAKEEFDLDLHHVAEIWRYGTVIRSWLLDLTADALASDQDLAEIKGWVDDSGEGRWTVLEAIALDIPAPVITLALLRRLASRQDESYAFKLLAAMRNQFGGHTMKMKNDQ